jgi:hypothetical protein
MSMAVKCPDHHPEIECMSVGTQATIVECFRECTTNIICNTPVLAINVEQAVYNG